MQDFCFKVVREFDATLDRKYFDSNSEGDAWPVIGGAAFNIWTPDTGERFAWANETTVVSALSKKRRNQARTRASAFYGTSESVLSDPKTLPCYKPRIAFRLVTNATDTRTLIAALVPPKRVLTNAAPYLLKVSGNEADEAYLLGILSSIPLDWYARRYVVINMNTHIFNGLPIPDPKKHPKLTSRLIEISARLSANGNEFTSWANKVGVNVNSIGSETEKHSLICEVNAISCLLYELSIDQVRHIFKTFHRGWNYTEELTLTLAYYEEWSKTNVK